MKRWTRIAVLVFAVLLPTISMIPGCVKIGNDDDPQIEAETGDKKIQIN
jgi:hypothetical protein